AWITKSAEWSATAALVKPSSTPRANSAGVESAFANASELFASSKTTTSVNVPPMSTATRKALPPSFFPRPTPQVQNVSAVQIVQAVRKFGLKHLDSSDVLNILNYLNYLNTQAFMPALRAPVVRQIFAQPFVPRVVDLVGRAHWGRWSLTVV